MRSYKRLGSQPARLALVADEVVEFHASRLLLLFSVCGTANRIEGLTKLAKLDFFVRYPAFFERLTGAGVENEAAQSSGSSVESPMVRHHYGPWDRRYYHVLAYLEARNLIRVTKTGRAYLFSLTDEGRDVALSLQKNEAFEELVTQMKRVKKAVGRFSGSRLKQMIYDEFGKEVAEVHGRSDPVTATPRLVLRTLERTPRTGKSELLEFKAGRNVIVGPPNSGKTKWLGVLDYLLGDRGQPADAFGDDVAEKYVAARAEFDVDGSTIAVERSWQKHGERQRVLVNGVSVPDTEFSEAWLEILKIPTVNFPQGDPHRELIWRELSWRSLWHHMFRKQTMWTDIADKQPESEQFACLLTFLGQAQHLFAPELGVIAQLLDERKQIESKKQQLIAFLHQATRDLLGGPPSSSEFSTAVIDDFVSATSDRIRELERLREQAVATAAIPVEKRLRWRISPP